MTIRTIALCLLLLTSVPTQAQIAFGVGGAQGDLAIGLDFDAAGNSYLIGRYRLTVDFDPGPGVSELTSPSGTRNFVASYTAAGALRFAFDLGATSGLNYSGIDADDAGNFCVTGLLGGVADFDPGPDEVLLQNTDGRIFVANYTSTAVLRGATNFGRNLSIVEIGTAVAIDGALNCHVTGAFNGETDFDPDDEAETVLEAAGSTDVFLASYTSDGEFRSAIGFGGTGADQGNGLFRDGAGNLHVTGYVVGSVDFDPTEGDFTLTGPGNRDVFVASYSDGGALLNALVFGGTSSEEGQGIAVDSNGNRHVTGWFNGTIDVDPGIGVDSVTSNGGNDLFIASYDASGALRYGFGAGNSSVDEGRNLILDSSDNVYVTGVISGSVDFDPGAASQSSGGPGNQAFVASYDSLGNYRNSYAVLRLISSGSSYAYDLDFEPSGNLAIVGSYQSTVDADPGPAVLSLASVGLGDDILYTSYSTQPTILGPGSVPSDSLLLDKTVGAGDVRLTWNATCSSADIDYGLFEGTLGSWYSHSPRVCVDAVPEFEEVFFSGAGDRYYLVVPYSGAGEGSYGLDGSAVERPVGTSVCQAGQDTQSCP